jgi:hypothetical protein
MVRNDPSMSNHIARVALVRSTQDLIAGPLGTKPTRAIQASEQRARELAPGRIDCYDRASQDSPGRYVPFFLFFLSLFISAK